VAGAPVGYELAEGAGACVVGPAAVGVAPRVGLVAVAVGLVAVAVGLVAVAVGRPVDVARGLAERLAPGAGEPVGVPVFRCVDVDGGVNIAGAVEDGELVHAETVAKARTVKVAQLTTVSLALPVAVGAVMRTFMRPPYARRATASFPAPGIAGNGVFSI
jgi:hypothetical protein